MVCLSCSAVTPREDLQGRFVAINPEWSAQAGAVAPDGDVFLEDEQVLNFRVPSCQNCGGILKPEVTFFGDTVSKTTVEFVHGRLAESDSVLVVGSSLQVQTDTKGLKVDRFSGIHFFLSVHRCIQDTGFY